MNGPGDWSLAEVAARAALATHGATSHLAAASFMPIDASLSNFAWRADVGLQQCFVRLARVGSEALGADLQAEARILQLVSEAGLAPPVLRCDPTQRLLVTHWIDPVASELDATDAAVIESVAQALARLHRLAVPGDLRRIRFDAQARMLRASSPATEAAARLDTIASDVFALLDIDGAAPVLCHHDIHTQNLVIDAGRRLWLVDWEYAGLNDPAFDLASFASQSALSADATQRLCAAYARAGGKIDAGRLEMARWAFDHVQWLWYRGLGSSAGGGHGLEEASLRSDRIERSLLERASALLRCNNRRFSQHKD
jgi:thiamine kinase